MEFHRIAGQFYNRPLLLVPSVAETISQYLLSRIGGGRSGKTAESDAGKTTQGFQPTPREDGSVEFHSPRASRFYADVPLDDQGRPRPYRRTKEGIAIITCVGEFVNRGAWVGASSGLISYEGLKFAFKSAADDPETNSIILDMESPGGEAIGCFEAAAVVREAREKKPIRAIVNGMAFSAAYALAASATEVITMPTGEQGSIGVVMLHLDFSKFLEEEGVKPTLIFAGEHKVDGNPFEPLPKNVRDQFKKECMGFYDQFIECVAAGRMGLSAEKIRGTQAQIYKGQDAIDVGLADRIGTFESVLAELSAEASSARSRAPSKGATMSKQTGEPGAEQAGITHEAHSAAVARAKADGIAEGKAEGQKAAQERLSSILGNPKVKGKEQTALKLAMESPDMSAEKVVEFVAGLPAAGPTIRERAEGGGGGDLGLPAQMPNAKATMQKSVERINRSRGFAN